MKNGSLGVGAVTKAGHSTFATNTCAYDSIMQILSLCMTENKNINLDIDESKTTFMSLTKKFSLHGLNGANLYPIRTQLLFEFLGNDEKRLKTWNNCSKLNCAINISHAASYMLSEYPSCRVTSECINGCSKIEKTRVTIMLAYKDLFHEDFSFVMQQKLSLPDYSCDFCSNMITTSLTSTGITDIINTIILISGCLLFSFNEILGYIFIFSGFFS